MKTTIDIPDALLEEARAFSGLHAKRDVVVTALSEYTQRHRMKRLIQSFGTCDRLMSSHDLETLRSEG